MGVKKSGGEKKVGVKKVGLNKKKWGKIKSRGPEYDQDQIVS